MAKLSKKIPGQFTGKGAKKRAIVFGIVVIMLVAGGIMLWKNREAAEMQSSASVTHAPTVASVPGSNKASNSYVKAQNLQNQIQVAMAKRAGKSAVPTITRSSFLGSLSAFNGSTGLHSKQCMDPRKVYDPTACSVLNLKQARGSGVLADELKCKGCQCPALKEAGYTIGDLRQAGFSAKQLSDCGFTLKQLLDAGFTSKELKAAGFNDEQLKAAGYQTPILNTLQPGQIANPDCSEAALKQARAEGQSAAAMLAKGCGVAALKAAGYTAKELKDAGVSAKDLLAAGYSPAALREAGFTAKQLKDAGLTAGQLAAAGYSAKELKDAGFSPEKLRKAGFTADELKKAGFTPAEIAAGGYTKGDLMRAGFSSNQIPKKVVVTENPQDQAAGQQLLTPAGTSGLQSLSSIPSVSVDPALARLQAIQKAQAARLSRQQRQDKMMQMQAQMSTQAAQLLTGWGQNTPQNYKEAIKTPATAAGAAGVAGLNAMNKGPVVKAGTILFAVLDTGINSDENSPIMAHIISGPYKGAKLLGQFNRVDKRVVVSFNLLSLPQLTNTIPLNAVAIDQNTARTAMSTAVDNHYLLRYGTLFASSFVSGLSDAMMASGTSTTSFGGLVNVTTRQNLDAAQKLSIAVGNVGQQYADKMGQNFDRPPTVYVQGGTGIGVLLMADLRLPESVETNKK